MLVVPADGPIELIVPRLEAMAAAKSPAAAAGLLDIVPWDETDDPHRLVADRVPAGPGRVPVWGSRSTKRKSPSIRSSRRCRCGRSTRMARRGIGNRLEKVNGEIAGAALGNSVFVCDFQG